MLGRSSSGMRALQEREHGHPASPLTSYCAQDSPKLRDEIISLIKARKRNGIRSDSRLYVHLAKQDMYVADVDGQNGKLRIKLGPGMDMEGLAPAKGEGWKAIAAGDGFCIWEMQKPSKVAAK